MEAERHKCYFNIFSPSVYGDNYSQKKKLFFQNYKINIVKLTKFLERFSKKVDYNEEKLISEAEYESRNIPLTLTRSSYWFRSYLDCQLKHGKLLKKK